MKYWLITSEYPPFFGGGISTYCYHTAIMMAENGHTVTIFINDAAVSGIAVDHKEGVRIIRFNPSRTNSSSFLGHVTNISYEFAAVLKQFIEKEGKPDIIESQEYLGIAYYLLQFKTLQYDWCKDIPVVITMHSPSFLYMEYNYVPRFQYPNYWICEMERFCLQAATLIFSPSRFMLDELNKRFVLTNTNIAFIPNPFKDRISVVPDVNSHQSEIVFYGKLTVQKGAFKLLGYFKNLWDNGFKRPLFIIGGQDIVYQPEDISMGDWIRKNFKTYIRDGLLRMEGRISGAEIGRRLAAAELVIVPSMNDNLPYVVFEMMALGKILLVSKQGGQSEVIENGKDGFIFDHEIPETFQQQLFRILELKNEERQRISQNALRKVNAVYGPDTVYKQKMPVLENLVQHRPDPGAIFPFIRPGKRANQADREGNVNIGLLTVVVPYYNMGLYIDETIQSILQSDYPQKEILIINDGSTDEQSIQKLATFASNPLITILSGPNRGLAFSRNLGAANARGEYLAFLDADDKVDPRYYSSAIRVLKLYTNVDFTGCWTKYFDGASGTWPTFIPEPPLILIHNTVNSSALVYRKGSFVQLGQNDLNMVFQGLEDYESVISILSKGGQGVVLPEVLFYYRVRSNSMIRSVSKAKKLLLYQHISSKYKDFYATFASDIFNLLNANGPGISLDNPSLDHNLAEKLPFGGVFSIKLISLIKRNRVAKTIAYKIYRWVKR